jgi:hypothetical protein
MIEGWPEPIEDAQTLLVISIGGVEYRRVRYGSEENDWDADRRLCRPACRGQAIGCDCDYDDDSDHAAEPEL